MWNTILLLVTVLKTDSLVQCTHAIKDPSKALSNKNWFKKRLWISVRQLSIYHSQELASNGFELWEHHCKGGIVSYQKKGRDFWASHLITQCRSLLLFLSRLTGEMSNAVKGINENLPNIFLVLGVREENGPSKVFALLLMLNSGVTDANFLFPDSSC